ncbi:aminotransferase class IV [Azotosporobacter soli]|uniref:aminotransferase class IV n=1 Tax=Azotosporobacter soli TaxID=3055040 RepID=UPI0031FF1859
MRYLYQKQSIVTLAKAAASPFDHGFLYGNGLFETMEVWGGRPVDLAAHIERLRHGAKVLGWPDLPLEDIRQSLRGAIAANQVRFGYVRLTLSRGIGPTRPNDSICGPVQVWCFADTIKRTADAEPWSLSTVSIRRNETSPLSQIKSANYLESILARKEAKAKGSDEALMLNTFGLVAECSTANLFFVKGGNLLTPDRSSGILPGVVRQRILQLADCLGIHIEERNVWPEELQEAEEVFLTSSLLRLQRVSHIDNIAVGAAEAPLTKRLSTAYAEWLEKEGRDWIL